MPIRLKASGEPFYEEAISSLNSSSQKFIFLRLEEQATQQNKQCDDLK